MFNLCRYCTETFSEHTSTVWSIAFDTNGDHLGNKSYFHFIVGISFYVFPDLAAVSTSADNKIIVWKRTRNDDHGTFAFKLVYLVCSVVSLQGAMKVPFSMHVQQAPLSR